MPDHFSALARMLTGSWLPATKAILDDLVRRYAGQDRLVVFDLDNTLLCRDIGDIAIAYLAVQGQLDAGLLRALAPPFSIEGITIQLDADGPLAYYEALQRATWHQPAPGEAAAAYAWAVQAMAGLSVADVLYATEHGLELAEQGGDAAPYPRPFVYTEMAGFVGLLRAQGFRVCIVSATNVWSVRWVVQRLLNPEIQLQHGAEAILAPDDIVGLSLLVEDRETGQLWHDQALVEFDPGYAYLEPDAVARYRLTPHFDHPVPAYLGKVSALRRLTDEAPLLAAGDSPSDLPLLQSAAHRLWMARLDQPDAQAVAAGLAATLPSRTWLIQPVLTGTQPGFVDRLDAISPNLRTEPVATSIHTWHAWLSDWGLGE